jgi:4'-phosphopantetheinyl transferase
VSDVDVWSDAPEDCFRQMAGTGASHGLVHIWRTRLDGPAGPGVQLERFLAQDELARAERYHFAQDRQRYVARRFCLRWLLGRYLDVPAAQIRFRYNAYGKPGLAADFAGSRLSFNVSHSAGIALFGFTQCGELGVDLERIRLDFDYLAIGRRFFSPAEQARLAALPIERRPEAFFACWTRKEAYVKARGEGLSIPLEAFDVSLEPGQAAGLLAVRGRPEDPERWVLHSLEPAPGYAGAACVPAAAVSLACYAFGWVSTGAETGVK